MTFIFHVDRILCLNFKDGKFERKVKVKIASLSVTTQDGGQADPLSLEFGILSGKMKKKLDP